jgi:hypothetical protein
VRRVVVVLVLVDATGARVVVRPTALVLWSLTFIPFGIALRAGNVAHARSQV